MIIRRVLNNNAVSCLDESGNEIIVKGKGIAFHASSGDKVDESKIEQKFVLENKVTNRKFQEILFTIPEDCIEASESIIEMIKMELDKKISEIIYVTLTDHISNLLERVQMGIIFDNALLWDIKRMYKKEYQLGLRAVEIIREKFHIKLEDAEASFIALHIVNAELDTQMEDVYIITGLINQIYQMVAERFELGDGDEDDLDYARFVLHLRFFFERLIHQKNSTEGKNKDILEIMKLKYDRQYECMEEIVNITSEKFQNIVTEDEKLYLLIHIIKLTT